MTVQAWANKYKSSKPKTDGRDPKVASGGGTLFPASIDWTNEVQRKAALVAGLTALQD